MDTLKKTIPSTRHLVSLAGHDFDLPERFEYHLKDRHYILKFHFRRFQGEAPKKGDRRFRIGDQVHPVKLDRKGIRAEVFKMGEQAEPASQSDVYEVHGMIDLEYFPTDTKTLIINSPGYESDLHGTDKNFLKIGRLLKKEKCGSLVMYQHTGLWNLLDNLSLALEAIASDLEDVIEFCSKSSYSIAKSITPKLCLSGFSMGGGAAAVAGGKNNTVQKMLLIAPSPEKRADLVIRWLSQYRGELYFVHGQMDGVIPLVYTKNFIQAAKKARKIDLVTLKKCDHRFTGEKLQKEFIDSYLRVFAADS